MIHVVVVYVTIDLLFYNLMLVGANSFVSDSYEEILSKLYSCIIKEYCYLPGA